MEDVTTFARRLRAYQLLKRWLVAEMASVLKEDHNYLSTACWHGAHERCRLTCKFCHTPCLCKCHG